MSNTTQNQTNQSNQTRWVLVDADGNYFRDGLDVSSPGRADKDLSLDKSIRAKYGLGGGNRSLAGLPRRPVMIEKKSGKWVLAPAKKSLIEGLRDECVKQVIDLFKSNFGGNATRGDGRSQYEEKLDCGAMVGWEVKQGGLSKHMSVGVNFTFYFPDDDPLNPAEKEYHDYEMTQKPFVGDDGELVGLCYVESALERILDRLVAEEKFL